MSNNISPRILIVDDNPAIHADFHKILGPQKNAASELAAAASALFQRASAPSVRASFEVDTASQGQEGLEKVKTALTEGRPYEVAFVDMRMPPGWDGLETIVHLWEAQPNLQVIICTAYSDYSWEDINRRLNQSDRFLILKKPFDNVEVHQLASALTSRAKVERELADSTRRLVDASRQAGMAEVATGVLHNVGNVLNSVNVSASLVVDQLQKSKTASLAKVVDLFRAHKDDLGAFLTSDPQGKQVPAFMEALSEQLAREQAALSREALALQQNIDHIKQIVAMQQSYAKVSGALEILAPHELVEDALRMSSTALERHRIEVVRQFDAVPPVLVDRHKVLQILVNLISNAKHALDQRAEGRRLILLISHREDGRVRVEVTDNGEGIAPENLTKIFQHGFTTKKTGHGFGLHSGANAAREMGGSLTARSDGTGAGASFALDLPLGKNATQTSPPITDGSKGHASRAA
jgi:signal transduction histidine kinase